jgi:disulfide bond formation protein DsbB
MEVSHVIFIYGLLSIVALVATIWFAVMLIAARFSEPVQLSLDQTRERLTRYVLWGAFIVALLATLGSLYFSEIAHFEPCRLCWFQRIAMYPLVVILGIAAWKHDTAVRIYALPIAAIGAVIATYHYLLEWFPSIDAGVCTVGIPCSAVWFREFGFASIPFLAVTAFLLIITLLLIPFGSEPESKSER